MTRGDSLPPPTLASGGAGLSTATDPGALRPRPLPVVEGGATMTDAPAVRRGRMVTAVDAPGAGGVTPAADARGAVEIPPSLYGRFEGFELVGRGGMGAVYKARDLHLERVVAVKLLFGQDPGGGLLREARSQARLRHPHVCEVFEAGIADQVPFIVMRYVDGAPLSRARAGMTLEEKVRVVREIALALHEAHRLGIVHRDVKPGNILVERAEDGAYKPYIADFGIARDLVEGGATMTSVQGTPAFMAPEQAGGAGGSIDRRTDVYGLGATLYDTLAGHPPFVASTIVGLLKSVVEQEAPPLRSVAKAVPVDLEAVVMKCLEKDPAARYESAKALGEDLQSFLDGDPVAARRPSWGARLWKRARKHRGKVAAAALALSAGLSFGGLWLRDRRVAEERAALSRELGGSVREMELFLRTAHSMPVHDVERERDVVRARLRDIEARMAAAGEIGLGPGHDALGRGHLALQDARSALDHFQQARSTGYAAPGLDYAMGLARIELYREALEKANRIQKASEKEAFIDRIEQEHRAPALEHLRAALAQGVESPAYAHGLIALHEGRLEDALSRAEEAFSAAPWLYEAKKLQGDVLLAMGGRAGHDKVFDHARASALFERAAEAYRAAAELGRSDPSVHEAECGLWIKVMNAAAEHGDSMRPGFDRARAACERAIAASPKRPSSHLALAWAHNCFAFWVATGRRPDETPERALAEAAERVEAAATLGGEDAFARYLVGAVWRSRAMYAFLVGQDEGPALDRAVVGYESALTVDPGFLWALNEQCGSLAMRGAREARKGIDPSATFERALSRCGRALEIDPDFLFPRANTIIAHKNDAERLLDAGRSPAAAVERGLEAAEAASKRDPGWKWLPYWRARLHRIAAEYSLMKGEDASAAIARAEAEIPRLARLRATLADAGAAEAQVLTLKAEALLASVEGGAAPSAVEADLLAAISGAREALAAARAQTPWDVGYAVRLARAELVELRFRLLAGSAAAAHAEAVLAPIAPFLREPREDPVLYEVAARAHEARAELLRRLGQDDGAEITAAIELAEKAVAVGPGLAKGRAALGRAWLLRARSERDPAQKKEHARRAVEALRAAVRENGLLGRTHAGLVAEAERLSGG